MLRKSKKISVFGFAVGVATVILGSTAYACIAYRGDLTITGSSVTSNLMTGKNDDGMNYCTGREPDHGRGWQGRQQRVDQRGPGHGVQLDRNQQAAGCQARRADAQREVLDLQRQLLEHGLEHPFQGCTSELVVLHAEHPGLLCGHRCAMYNLMASGSPECLLRPQVEPRWQ